MEIEARRRAFTAFARHRVFSGARARRVGQPAGPKHIADVDRTAPAGLA
jgi:hypothetical protein